MKHLLNTMTEKPLNAKYYAFDQDDMAMTNTSESNDFITKLSTFMVSALNIISQR